MNAEFKPLLHNNGSHPLPEHIVELCQRLAIECVSTPPDFPYLQYSDQTLALVEPRAKYRPIVVDFLSGKNRHREQFGGGKGQMICKAVGLSKHCMPTVLDMTAGLGGDAFVLAALGCSVTMQERNPWVAAVLSDAVYRLQQSESTIQLNLNYVDSLQTQSEATVDVVYLDPMYPDTNSKAAANKAMTLFKSLVGKDSDAGDLLAIAKKLARYRVVVKRPKKGEFLNGQQPTYQQLGKSSRFDIYVNKGMTNIAATRCS